MWELLAIGTIGFWVLLALEFVLLLVCTEFESGFWATLSVIAGGLLLNYFGSHGVFAYLWANPSALGLGVLAYFVCGTIWSVVKWCFFVHNQLDKYNWKKVEWLRGKGVTANLGDPVPAELRHLWVNYMDRFSYGHEVRKPVVSEHKQSIYIWIAYWPFSLVWTIINDPVRKICKHIYHSIHNLLQGLTNTIWRGTKADFDVPPVNPDDQKKGPIN